MPARSRRLKLVNRQDKSTTSMNNAFRDSLNRWYFLEERLNGLILKQDALLLRSTLDTTKFNELQAVISNVEDEQTKLLSEIAARPCGDLQDISAKLKIWTGINKPTENAWGNPSDKLISSALADLEDHLDKS